MLFKTSKANTVNPALASFGCFAFTDALNAEAISHILRLQGLCFDQKIEKYVYKACPFGEAKQDNTQLGRNSEGVRIDADGKTMTLKFADGDACWNGPKRSLTLTLKCGDKERLAAIEEPSRCEYVGVFYVPAACDDA